MIDVTISLNPVHIFLNPGFFWRVRVNRCNQTMSLPRRRALRTLYLPRSWNHVSPLKTIPRYAVFPFFFYRERNARARRVVFLRAARVWRNRADPRSRFQPSSISSKNRERPDGISCFNYLIEFVSVDECAGNGKEGRRKGWKIKQRRIPFSFLRVFRWSLSAEPGLPDGLVRSVLCRKLMGTPPCRYPLNWAGPSKDNFLSIAVTNMKLGLWAEYWNW